MGYLEWFFMSTYKLLCSHISIFGYTFRFIDIDFFIMLTAVFIFVVRRLLDY